ncbi:alpha/beta hydrolase family protein [Streptosporangium saharense]|uniref:Putative dienelactone hydrolase n=1 Tax=Streptosporangium saharense TaxID=1706840 RepID=A0A7W7QLD8_9ACTN|nr:lipase [Streptosporangium saharense]MBB4915618.1 putative dienelactone hydrolase [Streptosporangium saharense]
MSFGKITAAVAGLALAVVTVNTVAAPASAQRASGGSGVTVTLPAPAGPYGVGTFAVRLVDRSRPDPLVKKKPYRELMVSLWYPAKQSGQTAPHMAPLAAADWDRHSAPPMGIPKGAVDWAATPTHARLGAPVDPRAGKLPVVLFGSGDGGPRTLGTAVVEDLASQGYLVVTVDHTYEADQVEFPGGRVVRALPLPAKLTPRVIARLLDRHSRARLADMRFVLDRITALGRGGDLDNTGEKSTRLPEGLRGAPDLTRIGALGQSLGGSVAAQLVHDDPRVDAGVNLDGGYVGPVAKSGVARPFLQLAAETHTRESEPSWKTFWNASTGWKRELRFKGAAHGSFTDLQALLPKIAETVPKVPVADFVGTIDPVRSVSAQRAYVTAFFDLHLRKRTTPLFEAPDARFPEVSIIP